MTSARFNNVNRPRSTASDADISYGFDRATKEGLTDRAGLADVDHVECHAVVFHARRRWVDAGEAGPPAAASVVTGVHRIARAKAAAAQEECGGKAEQSDSGMLKTTTHHCCCFACRYGYNDK